MHYPYLLPSQAPLIIYRRLCIIIPIVICFMTRLTFLNYFQTDPGSLDQVTSTQSCQLFRSPLAKPTNNSDVLSFLSYSSQVDKVQYENSRKFFASLSTGNYCAYLSKIHQCIVQMFFFHI